MQMRQATSHDYEDILNLWEQSVLATHDFLKLEDLQAIKKEIPAYFPHLDVQLWYLDTAFIGFSAYHNHHLEMLFLDPREIGKGYGKQIIQQLIQNFDIQSVDVNKDNEQAKIFYLKNGFSIVSESPTDGQGRLYPILHLQR
ncbi:GNAT family N-acetyltransferase [Lysinibacillus sp. ZYM-1]|uniref:GNAT family N-acetyltransferase n=1 Tax=Lysinibacillus sp. ZYM-1 TaxID=1681184 RepID=UPI0006CEA501|nr:GNAT family N-acetyltransferase [Lysinibacillus sp. ZYM-1]KPN96330.1 acetyltransferase [Lysinibacillus sp. ZYM-1]